MHAAAERAGGRRHSRGQATAELARAESCFEPVRGEADVNAQKVSGYVAAVVLAYTYACGGAPSPFSSPSTTGDAGGEESGGGDDGGDLVRKGDAGGYHASGPLHWSAGAGAANAAPSSSSSQYCCVGGAFYACPTESALAQCTSACRHDPTYDSTCASIDAGSNTNTNSSSSSSHVQPPTPVRNACGGLFPGNLVCGTGGACIGGGHCSGGSCYPNDVGNPCTYADDCGQGNHCTNGCCQSPEKGSACTAFWDCKSNTCTNGICQ